MLHYCPHTAPWTVETPSAGVIEHFNECSNVDKRVAAKQALTLSSTEVEEGLGVMVRLPGSAPSLQAFPFANQPSSGLSRFLAKSPGDGDYRLRPIKTVSLTNTSSAEWRLPETENSNIRPFSKPGMTQAHLSYSPSLEGWW